MYLGAAKPVVILHLCHLVTATGIQQRLRQHIVLTTALRQKRRWQTQQEEG